MNLIFIYNLMGINVNGAGSANLQAELGGDQTFSGQDIGAANEILEQVIGTDIEGGLEVLGYVSVGINILSLLIFVTTAVGLFKLSKKLGDEHSWLAFVPIIQLYTFLKTAGYSFWKGFGLLLLLIFVAYLLVGGIIGLAFIAFMPQLESIVNNMIHTGDVNVAMIITFSVIAWVLFQIVVSFIISFIFYAGMAKRSGKGAGTAVLMTLFPWCMLWIVANSVKAKEIETPIVSSEL